MKDKPPDSAREPRLLDHEVDGIHEYDNPMPRWWLYIFYVTVIYALVYVLNVIPGVGSGKGRIARYESEMARMRAQQEALAASQGPLSEGELLAMVRDPAVVARGREKYQSTCSPCHRMDGGGVIGPNLTDDYWIHGGRPLEILKTVSDGVLEKGMPAWRQMLSRDEIGAVVAYCLTLHDTHPPNPKEPQGEKLVVEVEAAAPGAGP